MVTRHDRPVVVGVDGSKSAVAAVRWAATIAVRDRLSLRLVHTYDMPIGLQTGAAEKDEPILDTLRDQGRRWLAEAREAAAEADPDLPTETVLEAIHTVPALLHESETASMVVLGTRELGALRGLLVGCTSVAVAAQAHCPVVIVRGRDPDMPPRDTGPVVVGVDGTEVSEAAIAFAFAEASAREAELVALHTWTESLVDLALAGNNAVIDLKVLEQEAGEALAERLAGWQEKYPDVHIQRDIIHDRPNRALRRCSSTAQLVVVGRRGRSSFPSLLLGSTSQHLLHHAWCPVAVVRADGGQ
jgi:nucleotide-binding universal stress UspA family protein